MMTQIFTALLLIVSGVLSSGTQQGIVSSTQTGQTLQIQPNVRKYNKHTATEKPCTTGSTTGTRKEKPDNSDAQDYNVPIGGVAAGSGYPYPYPYPYQPYNPYRLPQYEPQYPVEALPPLPQVPYYAPYYSTAPLPPPPYYSASPSPSSPPYYPMAPSPSSPPYYLAAPYHQTAYPAAPQSLYEQSTVESYKSPLPAPYLQQSPEQYQYFRQPATAAPYYYAPQQSPPHFRAHTYNRPAPASAFLQQRDVFATTAATAVANNAEQQYEQQQSGPFDSNQQFHK